MILAPDQYPAMIKIAQAKEGAGKMRINCGDDFRDVSTIVALHNDYCTCETFIDPEYALLIRKIGSHYYRTVKRVFLPQQPQSNKIEIQEEELPSSALKPEYKQWIDECGLSFGGLDMVTLEVLHGKDGKDYIIDLDGFNTLMRKTGDHQLVEQYWMQDTEQLLQQALQKF